ncbi:PLP-dependent cysteine synthase family protein [Pseudoclavibacter soli]|uniref:PLP-dependent cysteine synthase family protein n=1 Tax=Pseudoclavibacter soli TaxID=452623 RepID=UPI0012EC646D|nr:cysteine synthase family protein [Pseudoclavibacter soli]
MTEDASTIRRVPLPQAFPDASEAKTYAGPLGLVGNTPLVRVNRLTEGLPGEVYVKLDQYNFGGSSKDRIGINIVREAEAHGELAPGQRIIDNGRGNTVLGLAFAGIATGHPVTIVKTTYLSPEKERLLRFLGADVVPGRSDVPLSHPDNWQAVAKRHADEDPETWWSHQSDISYNPAAHYQSTGPEIWRQTEGRVTHFLAALGTGGTTKGVGTYLKERNPDVTIIGTEFAEKLNDPNFNLLPAFRRDPGWEQLERNWSANTDLDVLDDIRSLPTAEVIDFGWHVARTEGLVLGITSILSLKIALDLARSAGPESVIVSFSADSGRDYLEQQYNADWLRENGYAEIADKYDPQLHSQV